MMRLPDLLKQQQFHLESLYKALCSEQTLLVSGVAESSSLEDIVKTKRETLETLKVIEQKRAEAEARVAPGKNDRGAEAARQCGCLELWQSIKTLAQRARHLNDTNGSLIEQRMLHNQRVLGALRERTGQVLYDASGKHRKAGSQLAFSI